MSRFLPKLRRSSLTTQALLWFLFIALFPLIVGGWLMFLQAASSIERLETNTLQALAERQAQEIAAYLENVEDVARFMVLSVAADNPFQGPAQPEFLQKMQRLVDELDFVNLILLSPDMTLHSTVVPSVRPGTAVLTSDAVEPALRDIAQTVFSQQKMVFSDLHYSEALGQAVLYIAAPIVRQESTLGFLILALSADDIYAVVSNRSGFGETGETILATLRAHDALLLHDTRFDPNAAFTRIIPLHSSELPPIGRAVQNASGSGRTTDYRGVEVLAAWAPIAGTQWGLASKIDWAEAVQPIQQLRSRILVAGLITFILVSIIAVVAARLFSRPIIALTHSAHALASGDLAIEIPTTRQSVELEQLGAALRSLATSLGGMVNRTTQSVRQISATTHEINAGIHQQAAAAQINSKNAADISATTRQITHTGKELTASMGTLNTVSQETAVNAESGMHGLEVIENTMQHLSVAGRTSAEQFDLIKEKAEAIQSVIVAMTKVADRTNLLSLNAAIEARKAGEHGRGFAVVAREIQKLADQTAVSTLEIERTILEMLTSVRAGVGSMNTFSHQLEDGIARIRTVNANLSLVIQQVQGLPARFEQIFEGMRQQAEGAEQIELTIRQLSENSSQTAQALERSRQLLDQLRAMAQTMEQDTARFQA